MDMNENQNTSGAQGGENTGAENTPKGENGAQPQGGEKKPDARKELRYTDEDVDRIVNKRIAREREKQDEAKRLAEMNAQERAEHERDELQKEIDKLRKAAALADMTKTARGMLHDAGIHVSDELLAMLVSADADETKNAVDGFTAAFEKAVEAAVKDKLRGDPPKRGTSTGGGMTKEQIMAIRDPELRQRKMLENRSLFNI